jgi:hypothetical protein
MQPPVHILLGKRRRKLLCRTAIMDVFTCINDPLDDGRTSAIDTDYFNKQIFFNLLEMFAFMRAIVLFMK